ncbi:MAG: hypothetical protein ACYDGY_03445 [Acidimicrobiales bacterium]
MLECVINVSEGRDDKLLKGLCLKAGRHLLDVHSDKYHNRSVLTLAGPDGQIMQSVRDVALAAIENIDISRHTGVHPRLGILDVVPFVPLRGNGQPAYDSGDMARAIKARDDFSRWLGHLGIPCFKYGPDRSLPEIRKGAFSRFPPDDGPPAPHISAGACSVGARLVLIAYNVWLATPDIRIARRIATQVRSLGLRSLGFSVGNFVQVSCNVTNTRLIRIDGLYDKIAELASLAGTGIARAELVGLVPQESITQISPERYHALDISEDHTIESRLARAYPSSSPPGILRK